MFADKKLTCLVVGVVLLGAVQIGLADDWNNSGGNAGRNGLSSEIGPDDADLIWSGGRPSLIAWQPVTEGGRVFMVRQPRWPYEQPGDSFVVAMDLYTGEELWAVEIPYNEGDWITWIAGARDGKVYASRAGNGASVWARMYALDAATGQFAWPAPSEDEISAGAYDGVVFAPNGDLIVASFRNIWRMSAEDGHTVWHATRTASVSGNCGAAVHGEAVYVADAAGGGHIIKRFDLATGAEMYSSPVMPGFTIQNTPMAGPDGSVYLSRTQNNPSVDHFYAFEDTGSEFIEKWHIPAGWSTSSEFGVGPDGSVYMMAPGDELVRLDPETGEVLDSAGVIPGFSKPRMAIDAEGRVFFSNGAFDTGRLYSFDADLTERWSVPVTNINIGGPALAQDGVLVVCGIGTDVRAYQTCRGDLDDDNDTDQSDLGLLLAAFGIDDGGDLNDDGVTNQADLGILLADWGCGSEP